MIMSLFKPDANFTGFINLIQGRIDSYISYESGSLWDNRTEHDSRNAFDYINSEYAAATDSKNKWISFSLLHNNYFYITHKCSNKDLIHMLTT